MEDHRDEFPVIRMCEVLNVSPSGYYYSVKSELMGKAA